MPVYQSEEFTLLSQIDEEIRKKVLTDHSFIAGGAITSIFSSRKINDFDIFFFNEERAREAIGIVQVNFEIDPKHVLESDAAYSFRLNGQRYQIIKAVSGLPLEVIEKFDFTICQTAYSICPVYAHLPISSRGQFIFGEHFLHHLAQRKLIYNINAEYPICSLFRIGKFINRGFNFSGIEAIKLGLKIESLDLQDYGDLRKQLMGIDTAFLSELTASLASKEQQRFEMNEFLEMMNDFVERKLALKSEPEITEGAEEDELPW